MSGNVWEDIMKEGKGIVYSQGRPQQRHVHKPQPGTEALCRAIKGVKARKEVRTRLVEVLGYHTKTCCLTALKLVTFFAMMKAVY